MKKIIVLLLCMISVLNFQSLASSMEVPSGTPILITSDKEIDGDDVKLGQSIDFTTLDPVKINGRIVIKSGTQVTGQVIKRKNNNICGVAGEVQIGNFKLKTAQGDMLNLRGIMQDKGNARTWVNSGLIFIVTIPLIFIKGEDGKIAPGASQVLYTIGDFSVPTANL